MTEIKDIGKYIDKACEQDGVFYTELTLEEARSFNDVETAVADSLMTKIGDVLDEAQAPVHMEQISASYVIVKITK